MIMLDAALIALLLLVVTLPVTAILSFTVKRQPFRRRARIATFSVAGTLALVIGGAFPFGRLIFGPAPPSLNDLQTSFPKRRSDLQSLLNMSNEDHEYARIAPDWVDRFSPTNETGQLDFQASRAPMLTDRWNAYRALYRRNEIRLGVSRNRSGDVFIIVQSEGLLNRGHSSGYLFCTPEPSDLPDGGTRFEPCTSQKTSDKHPYNGSDEAYSFVKLADHWYAYDDGPS